MARFELEVEHDFDFHLTGIVCHAPDYRLCWSLNRLLDINLERTENPIVTLQKDKTPKAPFPLFYFRNEENFGEYYLVVNKLTGETLMEELKTADYFLMLKGFADSEAKDVARMLRREKLVLTTFPVDVMSLKHKEILLF